MNPGTRLGPYEVLEPLGAGGMGEVYLADDTRLGRRVAIKVLPAPFAGDPERLARFEQEARAAAALNHPHIAAVYDIGAEGSTHFMVQEHLTGEPLATLVARGRLPLDRAIELGAEIAEALAAAHRAGVVHRDLKPDNVFVSSEGHAKVLDFGLAKLLEADPVSPGSESMSPTVVGTMAGAIMGTAGYMAPEQVQGEEIDHRADVFAFGCVLFEMLTGDRAFRGGTLHETLHRIVAEPPETLEVAGAAVPDRVRWIVDKCLAKDPARRYQTADDIAVDLRAISASDILAAAPRPLRAGRSDLRSPATYAAVAALIGLAALAGWFAAGPQGGSTTTSPLRLDLDLGPEPVGAVSGSAVALSPDGQRLVYANEDGVFVKDLTDGSVVQLSGEQPEGVAFGADGERVLLLSPDQVASVAAGGGAAVPILEVASPRGLTVAPDGRIVFSPSFDAGLNLRGLDGQVVEVVAVDLAADTARYPRFVPGRNAVVFAMHDEYSGFGGSAIRVLDLDTGESHEVHRGGTQPTVTPTGHLLYATDGGLFARRFEIDSLQAVGDPVAVLSDLVWSDVTGAAQYTLSNDGRLVYLRSVAAQEARGYRFVRVDRAGTVLRGWTVLGEATMPAISPDGSQVLTLLNEGGGTYLWRYDLLGEGAQRLTNDPDLTPVFPFWSPTGEEIVHSVLGAAAVGFMSADGGEARRVAPIEGLGEMLVMPWALTADARIVLAGAAAEDPRSSNRRQVPLAADLWIAPVAGGRAEPLVTEAGTQAYADLSPDSRWVAYSSDETGQWEVYLRSLDGTGSLKRQVSTSGGAQPRFRSDGRELFFRSAAGVMVVPLDNGLPSGPPRLLFAGDFGGSVVGTRLAGLGMGDFDAAPDGQSFVLTMSNAASRGTEGRPTFISNFFQMLEDLLPADSS